MTEEILTPAEEAIVIDTKTFTVTTTTTEEVKYTKAGEKKTNVTTLEVDNIELGRKLRVNRHPNGLVLELVPRYRYYYRAQEDRIIIPGQYTDINMVARYIIEKAQVHQIKRGEFTEQAILLVGQKLRWSGMWESRGMLKWRNVPDDFWKVVSIDNFSIGTVKSYYQWWLSALLKKGGKNGSRGKWYVKDSVHKDVEKGAIPEKLNSIRYWNQLTFDELMNFVARGWSGKKQWGPFVMNVKAHFYESLMLKHNDWTESDNFDAVVEYLARCPKSARMAEALNNLANSGLDAMEIVGLGLLTPKQVETAANYSVKFQQIYRQNQRHLNSNYKPPVIKNVVDEENPEKNFTWNPKYVWADSITFPNLSEMYSCCISRYGSYEDNIVAGKAHALYATDHTPENKGGVLAYISLRDNFYNRPSRYDENGNYMTAEAYEKLCAEQKKNAKWEIQEHRSFNNGPVDREHTAYIQTVVDQINAQLPGPHPECLQITKDELLLELVADPIGAKVKELWDKPDRRNRNRRY